MATTLNISGLTDYIKENRDELFVKSVAGSKTLDYVELYPNVVYNEALNYLDSEVTFGDGSTCTWDPTGSDTFSERFIEVIPLKINKEYCAKDMRKKWMNYQYNWEAGRIELPLNEAIANSNVAAAQEALEDLLWQGNSGLSFEGFIDKASGESAVIDVEFGSGATATENIDAMVAALPMRALKKGVDIFISYTDFRAYVAEQNALCCSKKEVLDAASETIGYFGDSRIRIVPVMGLEGTGAMLAAPKGDGLAYGTDIVGSEGVYKWIVDEDTDKWKLKVEFTAGVAIKYPDETVLGVSA